MPVSSWTTPTLKQVRSTNRDYIAGRLGVPLIPNDVPRVLANANGGNAHLALQYIDWVANQLLPDTAQQQFLDKWANIYLINADGSRGRKAATYASGTMTMVASVYGTTLPAGAFLSGQSGGTALTFQTTATTSVGTAPTSIPIRSLNAGAAANLAAGTTLTLSVAVPGINASSAVVVSLTGGADRETDDELRVRVLARIRQPPMGGAAYDYTAWAGEVAGVTRAWCAPMEMGVETVTLRVMCDDLRFTSDPLTNGFPLDADLAAVRALLDTVRPVTVKELWVCKPTAQPITFKVANLEPSPGISVEAAQASLTTSVAAMLARRARPATSLNGVLIPAQTISAAWVNAAILAAPGVDDFDLSMDDAVMPDAGCMAVLGPDSISF